MGRDNTRLGEVDTVGGCEDCVLARSQRFYGRSPRTFEGREHHFRYVCAYRKGVEVAYRSPQLVYRHRIVRTHDIDDIGAVPPVGSKSWHHPIESSYHDIRDNAVARSIVFVVIAPFTAQENESCGQRRKSASIYAKLHLINSLCEIQGAKIVLVAQRAKFIKFF